MSGPRIGISPNSPSWVAEAVEAGGGSIVDPIDSEGLIWTDPDDSESLALTLQQSRSVSWVQLPWAGVERMRDVIDGTREWTCAKGIYGEAVAEHALALLLAGFRGVDQFARASSWGESQGHRLSGAHVVIVGAGGVARSLVRLLEPFSCEISIIRRRPEPAEGVAYTGGLGDLRSRIPTADALVLALPLTVETEGIIADRELELLPQHAWLINVARGRHVDTDALVKILETGGIAGAALDVTEPEPLPDNHPLWFSERCIITPHTANTPEMGRPKLETLITENVRRFGRGMQLLGPVDARHGY